MNTSGNLALASYNVRGLRDDRRAVVDVARAMAPDLLILQEVPILWFWRRRCAALAADCGMRIIAGFGDGGCERGSGNLILAGPAISVLDTATLRLPHRLFQQQRTAVLARCLTNGEVDRPIIVVGTHLSTAADERGDQIERVMTATQGFAAQGAVEPALFVAGDFNEQPGGVVWRRLSEKLADAGATDSTPTFSTSNPRRRIDAIFYSGGLTVRSYRVWRAGPVRAASDHFPVLAELEFKAPREL